MTDVPVRALPNTTSLVSRRSSPTLRASARWSITVKERHSPSGDRPGQRSPHRFAGWFWSPPHSRLPIRSDHLRHILLDRSAGANRHHASGAGRSSSLAET